MAETARDDLIVSDEDTIYSPVDGAVSAAQASRRQIPHATSRAIPLRAPESADVSRIQGFVRRHPVATLVISVCAPLIACLAIGTVLPIFPWVLPALVIEGMETTNALTSINPLSTERVTAAALACFGGTGLMFLSGGYPGWGRGLVFQAAASLVTWGIGATAGNLAVPRRSPTELH